MTTNFKGAALIALFLGSGLGLCGYFISQTLFNSEVAMNTAQVKGLAEVKVKANQAQWQLVFNLSTDQKGQLPALYKTAEDRQQTIIQLLRENGFSDDEIEIGVIDYFQQEFRDKNQQLKDQRHSLTGSIFVNTKQVERVSKVRASINHLISQGIEINNMAPIYRFTNLNQIKPKMLREATQNARTAADEFAQIAGVKVGGIRTARQGNFSIKDAGENYGDTNKIEKDVRVVTTITFYLTE